MKFDSESLWKHASDIAYYVNAAYKAMKAKNECKTNVESYEKSINRLAKELQAKLGDESLPEEEQVALLQRLSGLNKVKVSIARRLQRLIL